MTESTQSPEDAAAARAAEQVRLRKERREAKIKAGAASRLNKITGLGGGIQRDPQPHPESQPRPSSQNSTPPPSQPSVSAAPPAPSHDDPEEVDISKHYYEPSTTARIPQPSAAESSNISEAQLRQMMLGLDNPVQNPFLGLGGQQAGIPPPGMEGMDQDPMMKMLSQMMAGGMPGAGGPGGAGAGAGVGAGANPFAGTGMENLFGRLAGMPGGGMPNPMQQQAQQTEADKTARLWRIVHAIFALGLGLYVVLTTTFTGTRAEREQGTIASRGAGGDDDGIGYAYDARVEQTRAYFFYLFSSAEAVLLTTRYLLLDRSSAPPTGLLWSVAGFLPDPFQRYLRHGLRYFQIFTTVRTDLLVCVFVLGVCCWLRT